jgi:SNF2 family DNA or RNA helicase
MGSTVGQEALLGSFSRLRLVASLAKVDATVALAKSILEKEGSIVIFTYFVKVAKQVYKKLNELGWSGEFLAGETPVEKRQVRESLTFCHDVLAHLSPFS